MTLCSHLYPRPVSVMAQSHVHDAWPTRSRKCFALAVRRHPLLVRRARWTNDVHSLGVLTCAIYVYALCAHCLLFFS